MFGIFGIISEKIVNNKSGNHNNLCLLVLAWTAPRSSKQQPKFFSVLVYWSARDVFVLVTVLQFWIVKKLSKNAILHYISGNFPEVLPDVLVFFEILQLWLNPFKLLIYEFIFCMKFASFWYIRHLWWLDELLKRVS